MIYEQKWINEYKHIYTIKLLSFELETSAQIQNYKCLNKILE